MNINEEIQKASDKIIADKLPEMVEKAALSMLTEIIRDVFSGYSPMAKEIKQKIESKLDINLQNFALVDYNVIVSNIINEQLVDCVNEDTIKPIKELVKSTIGFVNKKEIKLSEIHQMVISDAMEESTEEGGEITFIVDVDKKRNWVEVYIDLDADTDKHKCSLSFIASTNRGTIFSMKSNPWYGERGDLTPSRISMLRGMEHKIFRMYSAGVKIEVDENSFENEWYRENY